MLLKEVSQNGQVTKRESVVVRVLQENPNGKRQLGRLSGKISLRKIFKYFERGTREFELEGGNRK